MMTNETRNAIKVRDEGRASRRGLKDLGEKKDMIK